MAWGQVQPPHPPTPPSLSPGATHSWVPHTDCSPPTSTAFQHPLLTQPHPPPQEDDKQGADGAGLVRSGHTVDGKRLHMDAAGGVTANIIAGLATSVAGGVGKEKGKRISCWWIPC